MDSSSLNWKERLKGWVHCRYCGRLVFYWPAAITHWLHEDNFGGHEANPALHALNAQEIEVMGVQHGRASLLDNPYAPDGPLYDGADSMGEAAVWYKGWEKAQRELGRIPPKLGTIPSEEEPVVVKPDDLDYLEFERD